MIRAISLGLIIFSCLQLAGFNVGTLSNDMSPAKFVADRYKLSFPLRVSAGRIAEK